jgi:hypothetical protein
VSANKLGSGPFTVASEQIYAHNSRATWVMRPRKRRFGLREITVPPPLLAVLLVVSLTKEW